jgi:tetratricopeptide (TPR) repeat protein
MELTIEQALQQGVAAHKEGKLKNAEDLYRVILQTQPLHPDANHNLGVLAVSANKTDAALALFKTALEANPKIEQFWLSYINALIKTEKFTDARQTLAEAKQAGIATDKLQIFEEGLQFELSPSSYAPQQEFSNQLQSHQDELTPAIELREAGRYKEAQEWLSKVIENDSRNSEALSLLSQVLLLDKKEAEAQRALSVAASINSELPSVYRNQARLLLRQSKTAEALEKAQLGCEQSPKDLESLLVLATCLGENKRDLEALSIIENILKAKSNYAEAFGNRALIKLRAKDTIGAIEDLKMTVSLKPHLSQMWQLLGSLHYQDSNLNDAIEALKMAHKNEPINPAFMIQLGGFLRQGNKVSEAIDILKKATEITPKDIGAWTNLGAAFQQEKRIAEAKGAYEKALILNPKSAAISSNLGAMAKEAKEWGLALKYFEKALEIEPNFAEAHYNLGITLNELGRSDEAEGSWRRAIALKPDSAEAHSNLGSTLQELGRLEEAISHYTQASFIDPKNPKFYMLRGLTPSLINRPLLINQDKQMKSINDCDWATSEKFLKQSFTENSTYTEQNVAEFISLWCALCRDLINQNAIERLIPIFIKLYFLAERNKDVDNLIRIFYENIGIDKVLELVRPEDSILINLSYCQYNFLKGNFFNAEALAIENIKKSVKLIKDKKTEDLGWLVVRRSLALCARKNASKTALSNLISNLVN